MDSQKKETRLLSLLSFFVIALISDWRLELFRNGWSLRIFLNIPIVLFFLLFSYLIETRTELSRTWRNLLYGTYIFVIGSVMSFVIYHNPFNFQSFFLYFSFAFFGSIIWGLICQILANAK